MNIKNSPSVIFSSSITPMVNGDFVCGMLIKNHYWSSGDAELLISDPARYEDCFVISYADRQNTGKQPVADGVRVNMKNDADPFPARFIFWDSRTDETWKPDHAYMVKAYQKSNKQVEPIEPVKPIYTQAMFDAGELPMVGMMYQGGEIIKGRDRGDMFVIEEHGYWILANLDDIKPINTDEDKLNVELLMKSEAN